jgi:hypothetical protein
VKRLKVLFEDLRVDRAESFRLKEHYFRNVEGVWFVDIAVESARY